MGTRISCFFYALLDSIFTIMKHFYTFKYYSVMSGNNDETKSMTLLRNCASHCLESDPFSNGFSSRVMGPLEFILRLLFPDRFGKPFHVCPQWDSEASTEGENFKELNLSDLTLVNTLGEGGFSKVHLVRRISNSRLYALKVMEKPMFAEKAQRKHVIAERDILLSCENPYIVRLYRTFRDSERLYMLMEFCTGSELWTLIHKKRWLSETTSKRYCAAVLEALDYLHQRWIAHRDLKPENVIIGVNGTPKLIDFGFAKKLKPQGKTYSFLGTPQYVAPEMILKKGHDTGVDLWAVGILIYEMLTGAPPFMYQDNEEIYEAALRGFDGKNVRWPARLSREAIDLIEKLCCQNPTQRLGYRDIQEVRQHKWFKGCELNRVLQRSVSVPQTCRECMVQEQSDWYSETISKFESNWDSVF